MVVFCAGIAGSDPLLNPVSRGCRQATHDFQAPNPMAAYQQHVQN